MKLISLKTLFLFITVCGFTVLLFTNCGKEETDITAVVTVKAQWDTNIVIPFADIVIGPDYDDVKVSGKTDATGMFSTTFKLEAILRVVASKDTNTGTGSHEDDITGEAVIRLKPGETAYKTVYVH